MKKYYLVSTNKFNRNPDREMMDDFSEEDFAKYDKDQLPKEQMSDLQTIAMESQGFEWWIEEVDE